MSHEVEMEILTGNELLIQGGLEAGIDLFTGYPGSPLADYFNILHQRKKELARKGIHVVIANSEANAAAMASGAKMAGQDTMVAMKSMGLHVAADALSVGNFANPGPVHFDSLMNGQLSPGVVVVVGDDPWSISTSTPADSRYLFKHLHIPFLEPSTPQELKDWVKVALNLSKQSSVYVGLLLTTSMAEGGGRVALQSLPAKKEESEKEKIELDPSQFDLKKNVMVPPNSLWADQEMIERRFPKVEQVLRQFSLDQIEGNADSSLGFLSAGVVAETLKQVLEEKKYLKDYSLYKLASSYPLVEENLLPYLKKLQALVVVEEKRGFLEGELKELCQKHGIHLRVYGKKFGDKEGFPAYGGLSFEILAEKMKQILVLEGMQEEDPNSIKKSQHDPLSELNIPPRYPTFCPGCPHRETLSLLKEIRELLNHENIKLISHGDVGCYSLSFLPPFREMHDLSAMGQGGALGAGTDIFIKNPSVVLMGDSTFFHSGISAISNSLQLGHNITYILLDNDNTAMTGHQMTPASGVNVEGDSRPRQEMYSIVKAMGVKDILEVNPSDRYFYKNQLLDFIKKEGLKVIVSNKECALTFHGRKKAEERKIFAQEHTIPVKTFYQINTQACEDCRECVEMTGCPGLGQTFDAYGSKVMIDPQICVSDSYCTMIKACPSFEKVDVFDYHPTLFRPGPMQEQRPLEDEIPRPTSPLTLEEIASGRDFRVVVTGVGGSGVTTISRVLAEAAKTMGGREDLDFKFFDQKGLAQRNGSVTGFLSIFRKGKSHGTVIPKGTADLVVSTDLLEGARAMNYLAPNGWAILDSDYQIPLSILLDRAEKRDPLTAQELGQSILAQFPDRVGLYPLKAITQEVFSRSVYASTMCLGIVYQAGRLPFDQEDLLSALKRAIPKGEWAANIRAFHLGRELYLKGIKNFVQDNRLTAKAIPEGTEIWEKSLSQSIFPPLRFLQQKILARFRQSLSVLEREFPFIDRHDLGQFVHDILLFDRGMKLNEFLGQAKELKGIYENEEDVILALRTLTKTYFIKDEIFVAHLLISPLKRQQDLRQYGGLGKGLKVSHINRPSFDLWGKKVEFDIHSQPWMLAMMRHMRVLRTLLPTWHNREKAISRQVRERILVGIPQMPQDQRNQQLRKLNNIKGYREVRYRIAERNLDGSTLKDF